MLWENDQIHPRISRTRKAYSGEFLLGATTPSYDLETEIDQQFPSDHITPTAIAAAKEKFIGKIMQRPLFFLP